MKLICDKHNRRVLATATSFIHRTGDESKCDSPTATINSQPIITPKTIQFIRRPL